MESSAQRGTKSRALEQFLAILAAVVCLIVTVRIWQVLAPEQPMWPLPGAYLVEILALSMAVAGAVCVDSPAAGFVSWVAFGATVGFALLAAFTVGFLYVPVAVLIAIAGALLVRRKHSSLVLHLCLAIVAGAAQAGLILAVVRLL